VNKKKYVPRRIILKTAKEIEKLRAANQIVAEVLQELKDQLTPGISTADLDKLAYEGIRKRKARPAFKGYHGYPASLCVSINEEVVHGIPSPLRIIKEGDVVSMDLGTIYDGYYGDAAITEIVGTGSLQARALCEVTRDALYKGIEQARPKNRLYDISNAIQQYVEVKGYSVVRQFVGHGIGKALHEPPEIPNYGRSGEGPVLKAGMVLAIEPMVNIGGPEVKILDDGWTAVTADGSLSAHFEHSIAISKNGPVILSSLE